MLSSIPQSYKIPKFTTFQAKARLEDALKSTSSNLCKIVKEKFDSTQYIKDTFSHVQLTDRFEDEFDNTSYDIYNKLTMDIPSAIEWCLQNDTSARHIQDDLINMIKQEVYDSLQKVRQTMSGTSLGAVGKTKENLNETPHYYYAPILTWLSLGGGIMMLPFPLYIANVFGQIASAPAIGLHVITTIGSMVSTAFGEYMASGSKAKEDVIKYLFKKYFTANDDQNLRTVVDTTLKEISEYVDNTFDEVLPKIVEGNISGLVETSEDVEQKFSATMLRMDAINLQLVMLELRHQHLEIDRNTIVPISSDRQFVDDARIFFYDVAKLKLQTGEIVEAYSCRDQNRSSTSTQIQIREIKEAMKLSRVIRLAILIFILSFTLLLGICSYVTVL